jgi:hypothetical protein
MKLFSTNNYIILLTIALTSSIFACKPQTAKQTSLEIPFFTKKEAKNEGDFAGMEFEKIEYNFGKVEAGTIVKCSFKFKNTGTKPLIISEVAPQCGCTTTNFPKEPIAVNQTGEILLELDTKDKKGAIEKNARVVANIEGGLLFLFMRGDVESDELIGVPPGSPR